MDPLVLSAGAGSGSPVHTQVSCPTASLIHQAFPAGKGKRSHPDSVTLSLRTANDLLGIGDTFISPQQLRKAMDTTGKETHDQTTQGTQWSAQRRSEPCNCAPARVERQRSSSLRFSLGWSRRMVERDYFLQFLQET